MVRNKHLDCHLFVAVRFFLLINSFMSFDRSFNRSAVELMYPATDEGGSNYVNLGALPCHNARAAQPLSHK